MIRYVMHMFIYIGVGNAVNAGLGRI